MTANVVLHEITTVCPRHRIVILEDTIELQCAAEDHMAMRNNEDGKG
jgi:Flp pilus assembly CpaF family ATPase